MKQEYSIYFHLGLPKVASTFLQNEIFPYLMNINFHRKHKFRAYKQLNSVALESNHLFSSEKDRELEKTVAEITSLFPEAKFILLVRRQDQWILSRYKYHIRKHGWRSFEEFFNLESNNGVWKREELFFQKKIEYLEKMSKTKPLVLTHDLLKSNPELFFQQICQYMDTAISPNAKKNRIVNKAFNKKQLIFLRKFNRLYRYERAQTPYKFLNRVHYKYREFLLHTVAFFSRFLPSVLVPKEPILKDPNVLNEIQQFYAKDWEYCLAYSKTTEFIK